MNKEWVEQKNKERKEKAEKMFSEFEVEIEKFDWMSEETKTRISNHVKKEKWYLVEYDLDWAILDKEIDGEPVSNELKKWVTEMKKRCQELDWYFEDKRFYDKYSDSDPMEFDGDIIITDPCYIMRAEHHGTIPMTENDWHSCNYGYEMEVLGINNYMTRDTLYGDWGCTVYNIDTKEPIGNFCADAGLVSVIMLNDVLKYNPDFDYHTERNWTTTWIKDFKGTVQFVVEEEVYICDYDSAYHKIGDRIVDYAVKVVGHGINKVTGEPINFRSSQTGV